MSELTAFVLCCLIVAAMLAVLAYIFFVSNVAGGPLPKGALEALQLFRDARNRQERWFVVFLCLPMFLRTSYLFALIGIAATAFGAVALVFGSKEAELKIIRQILNDFYDRIERGFRRFSPAPHHSP